MEWISNDGRSDYTFFFRYNNGGVVGGRMPLLLGTAF